MKILLLGHNGILGNRIKQHIDCHTTNFRFPSQDFNKTIVENQYDIIINCIVDKTTFCSLDINYALPYFLSQNCHTLVHFCTDAVFSGLKPIGESYTKFDQHDPVDNYGISKSKISQYLASKTRSLIIRTSFLDSRSLFVKQLTCWEQFPGYDNYYWNGLTANQVALETKKLILNKNIGLYHMFGATTYSKYQIAKAIVDRYNLPTKVIPAKMTKYINRSIESDFLGLNFDITQLYGVL